MQKTAAGESTLFLYRRERFAVRSGHGAAVGRPSLGFCFSRPDSQEVSEYSLSEETDLVNGMENNFAGLGEHWPDSRYIMIDLSSGQSDSYPFGPWRCVYDTETGEFSVPPDCIEFNKTSAAKNRDDQKAWKAKTTKP